MIQLLFLVLFTEATIALFLMLKIGPLRELVMKGLDQLKMGKGPATVKTIAGTMSVILLSSVMSIFKIQNKGVKLGTLTPMDQVLWRTHLLEATLMDKSYHCYKQSTSGGNSLIFKIQQQGLGADLPQGEYIPFPVARRANSFHAVAMNDDLEGGNVGHYHDKLRTFPSMRSKAYVPWISYGTILKLMHEKTKVRLHSHDVPYRSGSGQQSVTGFPTVDDSNSYWIVRPECNTSAK